DIGEDVAGPRLDLQLALEDLVRFVTCRTNHDLGADEASDLAFIAANGIALAAEDAVEAPNLGDGVHRAPELPQIGVLRHDPQALLLASRPDDHGHLRPNRQRRMADTLELVVLALVRDLIPGQDAAHDRERLIQPVQ